MMDIAVNRSVGRMRRNSPSDFAKGFSVENLTGRVVPKTVKTERAHRTPLAFAIAFFDQRRLNTRPLHNAFKRLAKPIAAGSRPIGQGRKNGTVILASLRMG